MQSYKLNFLFFLCFFPFLLFGQDPYYINYDTKDGLPSSEVYDVKIDSNKIAWFTTDRGICSYNGYEFKTYTTKDGLSNNTHLFSYVDRKGQFWFIAVDGTLTILENGQFRPFKWNKKLNAYANGSWYEGLAWDSLDNMYFSSQADSLNLTINMENGQISKKLYYDLSQKYKSILLDSISIIDLGEYFLPDDRNTRSFKILKAKNQFIYTNIPDVKIKNTGSVNKISKTSTRKDSYTEYKINSIINIYLDDSNALWVCSESGLYRFNDADLNQKPHHYFKDRTISSIIQDFEGNYWVTTTENGVLFIPSFNFHTLENKLASLNKEKITLILPLEQNILFGTSIGEIGASDLNYNIIHLFTKKDKTPILFGMVNEGRAYLNDVIIDEKSELTLKQASLEDRHELKIFELKNGHFLTVIGRGFHVLSDNVEWPVDLSLLNSSNYLIFNSTQYFFHRAIAVIEHKSFIFIGTMGGLFSIQNYNYELMKNEGDQFPLLQNRINDIKPDSKDNFWLATVGEGVLYKTKDTLFQITISDGLNSNLINRTYPENDSTLWVASNNGLNKLIYHFENQSLNIKRIENYNTTDGLLTNYINDITKWKDQIWLATNKGINYFSPNSLTKTAPPPPIILEEITVNDSLLKIDEYPNLNYSQNDLYFKFTGISYRKATDKPFYRYRLMHENSDSTWYFTNNRDVRFNDLQAGKYTFEAAAQNKYGQWSEKPIIYQFSISPHFTRTWWFLILCIIAVISSIVFMVQSRSKRIKLREEQKRKLQEAELKTKDAELQALRNQMNPHFVFNALNSIQNFVFKNDAKKANYYLSRFSKLMRDGLQFARLKYILLEEEIIFLNTYLELEKMRFPDKFQYNVKVDGLIPTNRYYIPPLLFQPILENAVKHAFKNIDYEGLLEIHFEEKIPGELLKITIIDNGEGINPNFVNKHIKSKNKSLGLEIINNQIALLNSEGKDNKASFKIFNRKSIDPQLYGTQAEFIISIKFSEND